MGGRLIIKLDICMFGEGMRSDPTNDFIFLHLTGRSKIPWITFVQFLVGLCDALWDLITFNWYSWTLQSATNITNNEGWIIYLQRYSETTMSGKKKKHIKGGNLVVNSKRHSQKPPDYIYTEKQVNPVLNIQSCSWNWLPHCMVFFWLEMQSRRKCDRSSAE